MMGHGAGFGFGLGGWFWMLGMVLLVVGVVVVIAWLVSRVATGSQGGAAIPPQVGYPPPPQQPAGPDPIEVLRLRFARGQITQDEFLAAKQVLEAER